MNKINSVDLNSSEIWIQYMRKGMFDEAWKFSDLVLASGKNRDYENLPRHFQCIWDGSPIDGKRVLVRCYHGLGDTVQFIRYASLLKDRATSVIVWVQKDLIELLKTVKGIDRLIPLHEGTPHVEFDIDVEIMELPHLFRTSLTAIPSDVPYIQLEPLYLSENNEKLRIGLVWKAGNWNENRNLDFDFLKPLFEIEGIDFYILQENALEAGWERGYGINPGKFDLYNYAKLIRAMDLLMSIDSMPAHLAGAFGVPVWVMLHKPADWRWMENRSDSPWYPSMKLFRQETSRMWKPVVDQLVAELKKLLVIYPGQYQFNKSLFFI